MIRFIKQMFCKHEEQDHLINIHGDYINYISPINKIYRSIWICKKCDKFIYKEKLGTKKEIKLDGKVNF